MIAIPNYRFLTRVTITYSRRYQYFKICMLNRVPKDGRNWYSLEELREGYMSFCAASCYPPQDVSESAVMIVAEKFNLHRFEETGPHTERYTRIRPKTSAEKSKTVIAGRSSHLYSLVQMTNAYHLPSPLQDLWL